MCTGSGILRVQLVQDSHISAGQILLHAQQWFQVMQDTCYMEINLRIDKCKAIKATTDPVDSHIRLLRAPIPDDVQGASPW